MKQEGKYIHAKRQVLIVLSIFTLIGYSVDIFLMKNDPKTLLANYICVGVVLLSVLFTYLSILSIKQSFLTVVYSLIINIFISFFANFHMMVFLEAETLRAFLIVAILIPIAGFVISKVHSFIIGALLILLMFVIIYQTQNKYIVDNIYFLLTLLIAYTFGMYYILYNLEEVANKQKKLIVELEEKNSELEKVNSVLSEQYILIEIQKEELHNIIESRDKLYSVISHDIKNPLFAIISFCNLIKDKTFTYEYDKVQYYTTLIQISANNLHRLIINLLDWTRLHGGKLQVNRQLIDVKSNIEETSNLFDNSLKQKEIEFKIINQKEIVIYADSNMFNTIVRNLLSNAIKYTPSGGKISIESKLENDKYCCIISDSGVGIRTEDINTILQSNVSISTVGTDGEGGTGLGLELCKEFIKFHNGELFIKSELGVGSKFIVCLPVNVSS